MEPKTILPEEILLQSTSEPSTFSPSSTAITNLPKEVNVGEFSDLKPEGADYGLLSGMNQNVNRASNQSGLDRLGNFLVQAGADTVGGTVEGIGYLGDFQQHANLIRGTEDEFSNWLSNIGKSIKESTNEAFPIYEAKPGEFNPSDSGFWAKNGVSIASSLSLLIPARGVTGLLGKLGKGLGMESVFAKGASLLGKEGEALQLAIRAAKQNTKGITAAILSRTMENTMEASGTFEEIYNKKLAQGYSDEEAKQSAGEGARDVWYKNSVMLLQDIPQYMFLFKAPNLLKSEGKLLQKLMSSTTLKDVGESFLSETGEEVYQSVVGKEAVAKQTDKEYNNLSYVNRLSQYIKEDDTLTSGLFGGLGGSVVTGIGRAWENRVAKNYQNYEDMKLASANGKDNLVQQVKDKQSVDILTNHLDDLDKIKDEITEVGKEEGADTQQIKNTLSDIEVAEQTKNNLQGVIDDKYIKPATQINVEANQAARRITNVNEQLNQLKQQESVKVQLDKSGSQAFDYNISTNVLKQLNKFRNQFKNNTKAQEAIDEIEAEHTKNVEELGQYNKPIAGIIAQLNQHVQDLITNEIEYRTKLKEFSDIELGNTASLDRRIEDAQINQIKGETNIDKLLEIRDNEANPEQSKVAKNRLNELYKAEDKNVPETIEALPEFYAKNPLTFKTDLKKYKLPQTTTLEEFTNYISTPEFQKSFDETEASKKSAQELANKKNSVEEEVQVQENKAAEQKQPIKVEKTSNKFSQEQISEFTSRGFELNNNGIWVHKNTHPKIKELLNGKLGEYLANAGILHAGSIIKPGEGIAGAFSNFNFKSGKQPFIDIVFGEDKTDSDYFVTATHELGHHVYDSLSNKEKTIIELNDDLTDSAKNHKENRENGGEIHNEASDAEESFADYVTIFLTHQEYGILKEEYDNIPSDIKIILEKYFSKTNQETTPTKQLFDITSQEEQDDLEDKADIDKRRQEKLSKVGYENIPKEIQEFFSIDNSEQKVKVTYTPVPGKSISKILTDWFERNIPDVKVKDFQTGKGSIHLNITLKGLSDWQNWELPIISTMGGSGYFVESNLSEWGKVLINAKYDAELAALNTDKEIVNEVVETTIPEPIIEDNSFIATQEQEGTGDEVIPNGQPEWQDVNADKLRVGDAITYYYDSNTNKFVVGLQGNKRYSIEEFNNLYQVGKQANGYHVLYTKEGNIVEYNEDGGKPLVDRNFIRNIYNRLGDKIYTTPVTLHINKNYKNGKFDNSKEGYAYIQIEARVGDKVIGKLPALGAVKDDEKAKFGAIRKSIYDAYVASGQDKFDYPITTTIDKVLPARFWQGKRTTNIQSLTPDTKVILGYQKQGQLIIPNTNLSEKELEALSTKFKLSEGHVYWMIKSPITGEYVPYRLFTKKVKDVPQKQEQLRELIGEITPENWITKRDEIRKVIRWKDSKGEIAPDFFYTKEGKFVAKLNGFTQQMELSELYDLYDFDNRTLQVDENTINIGENNNRLFDLGYFEATLNPGLFHSPSFTINLDKLVDTSKPKAMGYRKPKFSTKTSEPVVKWNEEEETQWFKDKLGEVVDLNVVDEGEMDSLVQSLKHIHGRDNLKAWGFFHNASVWISKNAKVGTTMHESVHVIMSLLLTDSQVNSLYDATAKKQDIVRLNNLSNNEIINQLIENNQIEKIC